MTVALSLVLVGGALVGFVAVASAAGPSITVSPHAHLVAGEHVGVRGKGFIHGSNGAVLECNDAPGQPATTIEIHGVTHTIPIGCTNPVLATTSRLGRLASKSLVVATGTLGTWETGTDTAGNPAASDSSNYTCPPNVFQVEVGVSCVYEFIDNKGQEALHSISFKSSGGTGTTTTTTTTTTQPCAAVPVSASAANTSVTPNTTVTLTLDPGTCIVNGTVVSASGTGFQPSAVGTFTECNSDPGQPTVNIENTQVPVSCTNPFGSQGPGAVETDPSGNIGPYDITVVEGTVGPPCGPSSCTGASATDSAGGNPATDAADYPCPPTPAQVAAGDTCVIAFGDGDGDAVSVPLSFNPNS